MSGRRRAPVLGAPRLLWRSTSTTRMLAVLVLVLTAVVALLCGLAPRALHRVQASDLAYAAGGVADPLRDLSGVAVPFPVVTTAGDHTAFGGLGAGLAAAKRSAPAALRAVLGAPRIVARDQAQPATPDAGVKAKGTYLIAVAADENYRDDVTLTAGTFPATWSTKDVPQVETDSGTIDATAVPPMQIALSNATASAMGLRVGSTLTTVVGNVALNVEVSGLFTPRDASSDYWQNTPSIATVNYYNDNNSPPKYTATGFMNPATLTQLGGVAESFSAQLWYPIAAASVTPANASTVASGLRMLESKAVQLPDSAEGVTPGIELSSALPDAIDQSVGRTDATTQLLALTAGGPAGVLLAVFVLAGRAIFARRRDVLGLLAARGASRGQLRAAAGAEGLVIGVPAAVIGAIAAAVLLPGGPAGAWAGALLVGLVPAVLFGWLGAPSTGAAAGRGARGDLALSAGGRARWLVDIIVVGIAAIAVFLLLRRGPAPTAGFDPLLDLTPLLLALAVGVIVLRLVPVVLRALLGPLRRGRGLIGFLGAAGLVRRPALGMTAALAVIVGISVAVLASGVLTTVQSGARQEALAQVGADLRATQADFSARNIAAVAAAPGVAHAAATMDGGPMDIGSAGGTATVEALFGSSAALHGVQPRVPASLARKVDGRVPIVVSADLVSQYKVGSTQLLGSVPAIVVGSLPTDAQLGADSAWVLADASFTQQLTGNPYQATEILVTLRPGASPTAAVHAITAAAPGAVLVEAASVLSSITHAPAVAWLVGILIAAVIGSAVLVAIAVFAATAASSATRRQSLAVLRTLGGTGRHVLGLALWEIVPLMLAASVFGTLLGLALPHLVVATVDLGTFTGGLDHVPVVISWAEVAAVIAAVLAAVAIATALGVLRGRRADVIATVKMGGDP